MAVGDSSEESLVKFTPDGTKNIFATELSPTALAFNSAGNLFVGDYRSHSIVEFSPDGKKRTFAAGIGHAAFMIFDHKGNLFVADWEKDLIFKFTSDGVKSTFAPRLPWRQWPSTKSTTCLWDCLIQSSNSLRDGKKTTFAENIPSFAAFVFDNADNLFVADAATDSILKFSKDGTRSAFAGKHPSAVSSEEAESPSPDGRFAFVRTEKPDGRAYDLIEKKSGKVLLRVAESEEDSDRLTTSVLWSPDSQRFALSYSTIQKRSSSVAVYFRSGDTFREIELPKLPQAEIARSSSGVEISAT